MAQPTILVTGATGKTGGAVVAGLLRRGVPVRAMVRSHDARSVALANEGAEVVIADIFDPDQLACAMAGAQRAYFVPPFHPYALQSAVAFSDAARAARLEAVVHMSQWIAHASHPSIMTRQSRLMEGVFAGTTGLAQTLLVPGMFADNFLRVIDFASLLGIFPILTGEGRCAPVSSEDIAEAAIACLLAPERHDGMTYHLTGPELLSGRDMAAAVQRVVGHRVLPVQLPFYLFRKVARQQRVDPFLIASYRHYVADVKTGAFAFEGGVSDDVEVLTGRPAERFETIARRYAAMPFAQQTLINRLRAFVNFNLVPFVPAYDLDGLDRRLGFPMPPYPKLAMQSAAWREDRSRLIARQPRPV